MKFITMKIPCQVSEALPKPSSFCLVLVWVIVLLVWVRL